MSDKKYISSKEYIPRIHLPRSSLRLMECPLNWNSDVNYHTLKEIKKYEDYREDK